MLKMLPFTTRLKLCASNSVFFLIFEFSLQCWLVKVLMTCVLDPFSATRYKEERGDPTQSLRAILSTVVVVVFLVALFALEGNRVHTPAGVLSSVKRTASPPEGIALRSRFRCRFFHQRIA